MPLWHVCALVRSLADFQSLMGGASRTYLATETLGDEVTNELWTNGCLG